MAGEPPDSPLMRVDPNTAASAFSGVVSVLGDASAVTTGTLIAPRFVLTAAHVVGDPARMRVQINLDAETPLIVEVARATRHPRFTGVNDVQADFDLALLELAVAAPAAARRYPIYYGPLGAGQLIFLAGYGASGAGSTGPTVDAAPGVKRRGANTIIQVLAPLPQIQAQSAAVGPQSPADPTPSGPGGNHRSMPGTYLFMFRRPVEGSPVATGSLDNAIETGLASGDSGSPAFIKAADGLKLMGVNSYVGRPLQSSGAASGYGTFSGGSVVGRHLAWLWKLMNA